METSYGDKWNELGRLWSARLARVLKREEVIQSCSLSSFVLMDTSSTHPVTFCGHVNTTLDALRIINAARQGLVPRVRRRLTESERRSLVKSGSIFVFSVQESGMKRWTDGLAWTPSRIDGNFLVYRELNEKFGNRKRSQTDPTQALFTTEHTRTYNRRMHDQPSLKTNGLVKKAITVRIEDQDLHLVSYYLESDTKSGRLQSPSSSPQIMGVSISPELFCLDHFRIPLDIQTGPDGKPIFRGDMRIAYKSSLKEEETDDAVLLHSALDSEVPVGPAYPAHFVAGSQESSKSRVHPPTTSTSVVRHDIPWPAPSERGHPVGELFSPATTGAYQYWRPAITDRRATTTAVDSFHEQGTSYPRQDLNMVDSHRMETMV